MNKIALVTGSRRGIGLGIARALGREGWFVIVSATVAQADEVLDGLRAEGIGCVYRKCNIADPADRSGIFGWIDQAYGRLDLLVNNAGVAPSVRLDLLETTGESMDRLLDVNLKGTFFMCQQAANRMIAMQGRGRGKP